MSREFPDLDEDPMMSSARKLLFLRLAAKAAMEARQALRFLLHLQQPSSSSSSPSQQETQAPSRGFNT